MRGLKIVDADLAAWDMRRNGENRRAAALTVEQAVDVVEIARTATAGADRELAGDLRLGAGGESGAFFMPYVNPVDASQPPKRIGEAVQRIADDAVDSFHAGLLQRLGQILRSSFAHMSLPKNGRARRHERAEDCMPISALYRLTRLCPVSRKKRLSRWRAGSPPSRTGRLPEVSQRVDRAAEALAEQAAEHRPDEGCDSEHQEILAASRASLHLVGVGFLDDRIGNHRHPGGDAK